jgi:hypothetical protein
MLIIFTALNGWASRRRIRRRKRRSRLPDAAVMADCAGTSTRGWRQH